MVVLSRANTDYTSNYNRHDGIQEEEIRGYAAAARTPDYGLFYLEL